MYSSAQTQDFTYLKGRLMLEGTITTAVTLCYAVLMRI